ncbi:MAG: hypothetical protein ACOVRN_07365 [Flavobacterium sp.]
MKVNATKWIQFINKHTFIILSIVVIIAFVYNASPIMEGLTNNIGEYDFLAPVNPSVEKIDDNSWKLFIRRKAAGTNPQLSKQQIEDIISNWFDDIKNFYKMYLTKAELNYYIQNGKFPYNGYVMNYLHSLSGTFFPKGKTSETIKQMQKEEPNRVVYDYIIYNLYESKQVPLPLSAKIFLGQEKPPKSSSNAGSSSTSNTSASLVTSMNYKDLVSLCKKIAK